MKLSVVDFYGNYKKLVAVASLIGLSDLRFKHFELFSHIVTALSLLSS